MTAAAWAASAMTPRSCVIRITDVPTSRFRPWMSSRIWAWIVTSSAVVGSSASMRRGLQDRAMAIITRCRIPPLIWWG